MTDTQLDQLSINTIRTLSIDAVRSQLRSPGDADGARAAGLHHLEPDDAIDRRTIATAFVLSNGHASMLLWSVLHLTGTRAVNADYERLVGHRDAGGHPPVPPALKPSHPEYHWVSG